MFHIEIVVKPSAIDGLGLFTPHALAKGKCIYTGNAELDLVLSRTQYNKLNPGEQAFIAHYGALSITDNHWHLSYDHIRFCNHSDTPNIQLNGIHIITTRAIEAGEELVQDYRDFEALRGCLASCTKK